MKTHFVESKINMPMAMVVLPLRCSILQTSRGIILLSPIDFSAADLAKIRALGEVVAIVAPSVLHHRFISEALRHFPKAQVWGVPGLVEKRKDIHWNKIFTRDEWPFESELNALLVEGMPRMEEMAFFDPELRTLYVVDLCFNLLSPHGWFAPIMLRLFGTYRRFGVSRLVNRFIENRAAFETSMQKILQWNFNRIVMCHGEVLESNGNSMLRDALHERGFLTGKLGKLVMT